MADAELPTQIHDDARAAWYRFIDFFAPFRSQLFLYCRRLTGDVWDAEDLMQETLVHSFGVLGRVFNPIANPRGYLTRVATNLWIDAVRRRSAGERAVNWSERVRAQAEVDPGEVRDAASRLIETLSPQERAAFLLKEVFDMSLDEIAEMLVTSVGAVKTALHRGRKRLDQAKDLDTVSMSSVRRLSVSPALVDRFVERLNASDLPGLLDLMLDTATVEEVGNLLEVGRQQFQKKGSWLWHAVNVHPDMPPDLRPPKYINERTIFEGEPLLLGFMVLPDAKFLMAVARFEEVDGKIARIRAYNFNPEVLKEIAGKLGLVEGQVPYRFPMVAASA